MSEIDNKDQLEEQFISSQAFHQTPGEHVREITVGEQFEPQIIESFDPVTQESYRLLPATIHTKIHKKNGTEEQRTSCTTRAAKHWSLDLLLTDSRARDESSQQHNLANKNCSCIPRLVSKRRVHLWPSKSYAHRQEVHRGREPRQPGRCRSHEEQNKSDRN
jgi:hypothetical protein